VNHAAPVIVFTADDTAHVMYPFGTRQSDWMRDMPRLLARASHEPTEVVDRAYVVIPAGQGPAALYLVMRNTGHATDTLRAVAAPSLGAVTLHESMVMNGNAMMMDAARGIPVGAQSTVALAPGGFHGMIDVHAATLTRGLQVPLELTFARAGAIATFATVIAYANVDTATARR
jgi:copper(I)-binding protein